MRVKSSIFIKKSKKKEMPADNMAGKTDVQTLWASFAPKIFNFA